MASHPLFGYGSEVAPDVPDGLPEPLVSVDAPGEDAAGHPVEELQVNPGPLLPLLGKHNFSSVFGETVKYVKLCWKTFVKFRTPKLYFETNGLLGFTGPFHKYLDF